MKQFSAKEKERLCLENGTWILWSSMIRYSLIPIALIRMKEKLKDQVLVLFPLLITVRWRLTWLNVNL
ncbi:hypothetical protein JFV29_21395 [Peribacillus sp. TH16]|uniref:hypothetical protein n=1 Tax=Peribacillus TaxID=2675229 RepID=UPI001913C346|nr:hypothetical protein [Peribacillus sp. TH16]MBK5484399.1 hypothetical protein [Peribacillus sp. TH16]